MSDIPLSDKIEVNEEMGRHKFYCYKEKDVAEAVRKLKEEIGELIVSEVGEVNAHRHSDEIIDKIFGEFK